jgi:hypothetical protein
MFGMAIGAKCCKVTEIASRERGTQAGVGNLLGRIEWVLWCDGVGRGIALDFRVLEILHQVLEYPRRSFTPCAGAVFSPSVSPQ